MIRISVLTLMAFLFFSCQKGDKGDTGPSGATGANGSQGPQGATGSSNVIYSDWFSFSLPEWKDTVMTNIPRAQRAIKSASVVTQPILDSGVLIGYLKDVLNNIYPLPLTYNTNPARVHGFIPNVGKFIFYEYALDGSGAVANATNKYRYIIIPGGVKTNGRMASGSVMSYDAICEAYNIPK